MFDLNKLTPQARAYFEGMSPLLQATLVHSGINCTTKEELESFVREQGEG